jgi:hypothetical protein
MEKLEKSKLRHNFMNSLASVQVIVQSNLIFVRRLSKRTLLSKEELDTASNGALLLLETSMETILGELQKIEQTFNNLFES